MFKNVSEKRIQILEMVEKGKINASEAMKLLDASERNKEKITPKKSAKWLKVRVRTMDDKPKVNVNIPLSLASVGLKLAKNRRFFAVANYSICKLAKKFDPKLKESGLDQINIEEIMNNIKNGASGKIVDVEDEENQTRVKVYVE